MRRAFGGKNKFDFVYESIPILIGFDPSFKDWNRCNMLVHSWIMNSVEESITLIIAFLENAVNMRNKLKERFSQGYYIRISELCKVSNLKQESCSVSKFYTTLKVFWK